MNYQMAEILLQDLGSRTALLSLHGKGVYLITYCVIAGRNLEIIS